MSPDRIDGAAASMALDEARDTERRERGPNYALNWLAVVALVCFALGLVGVVSIVGAGDTQTAVVWGLITSPALAAGAFSLVAYLAVRALLSDRE